jgi:chromosome segregation ATPase
MATSKKKKNTTIDELARMVAKGFDSQDKKFARIEGKLEEHDSKFARIEGKLEEHDSKFARIEGKLEEHDKRFEELDRKYDKIMNTLDRMTKLMETYHQEFLSLSVKVSRHEEKLEQHREWIKEIAKKTGVKLSPTTRK